MHGAEQPADDRAGLFDDGGNLVRGRTRIRAQREPSLPPDQLLQRGVVEAELRGFNAAVRAVYDDSAGRLESLTLRGQAIDPQASYSMLLQDYSYLSLTPITISKGASDGKMTEIVTGDLDVGSELISGQIKQP